MISYQSMLVFFVVLLQRSNFCIIEKELQRSEKIQTMYASKFL